MKPPSLPERWRGANNPIESLEVDDIAWLDYRNVNCLRINFGRDNRKKAGSEQFGAADVERDPLTPYRQNIERLRAILPECRARSINVIVCASNIWGRDADVFWQATDGQNYRNHLPAFWRAFAAEFEGDSAIVAYDILNEPNYPGDQESSWLNDMLPRSVEAIRGVNPTIWLVVEPGPWGMPAGFDKMPPINDPYVIYSFHHYAPHNYTHQGVKANKATRGKLGYPGLLRMFDTSPEFHWDKGALRNSMEPARSFQQKHGVRMFVGEFSVIRWAPGGAQWLSDSIELFEEYGWDWAYHSTVGWNGWSPTFGPDAAPGNEKDGGVHTDRLYVLMKAWGQNTK